MAASVKCEWYLSKYAKFVYGDESNKFDEREDLAETLDVPCKGKWKVYNGKDNDLKLSYLESDHILITYKDIILESFSLINSSNWLKGVAKKDSLMMMNKLKDGNCRRFRIQFSTDDGENDGCIIRKQCTELLKKHFLISDYDTEDSNGLNGAEVTNIDKMMFTKLQFRKAYAIDIPSKDLKDVVMLCLTDSTFPSYVAEVNNIINNIGKYQCFL